MSQLTQIQEQILQTQQAIREHERVLRDNPTSRALMYAGRSLRKRQEMLEREFMAVADSAGRDVFSYRIVPIDTDTPSVSTVSSTIGAFQDLVSVVYDSIKHDPKVRRRIPDDVAKETTFNFGYTFAGSIGVVFTVPNERLLMEEVLSNLDDSIYQILAMSKAESATDLVKFARSYGIATIRSLYQWAKINRNSNVAVELGWHRNEKVRQSTFVQPQEFRRLQEIIEVTSDEKSTVVTMRGELLGADAKPKRFHFKPDDGEDIRGTFDSAINSENHPGIHERYLAKIRKTERISYATDKEEITYFLESLKPVE
ncbi:hypothetical protein [Roseiconus lacunae]|uniref:Uncharacterized protein n=1 Tax=Roseiconus lacunae TaxID=2605694 RepID=A0ABT7PER4_9BACT|nr:hypothetical protein [Roseiconus lacunae]MDM4014961.1 hypothetical protein [Roseiconus lacunae]